MLNLLNVQTLDELINKTIPSHIVDSASLQHDGAKIPEDAKTEQETLAHLLELSEKNKLYKSYIGNGFYDCHTPPVI